MSETARTLYRVTLPELQRHQCKWPVEEKKSVVGGFLFCGHRREPDSPYCERHSRIAYTTPQARAAALKRSKADVRIAAE